MNYKGLYKYILAVPLLLAINGCKDYLDVNDSPNNPKEVSPQSLLASGLAGAAFANGNELTRFSSVVMNYLAGAAGSPAAYDIYNTNGADFGNQWRFEIYGGALITNQKMIEAADKAGAKAYSGIGKIMNAYTFGLTTDVWGDVPYSEALRGSEIPQPRVDKQEDIYKGNPSLGIQSIFDLLREGIADLDAASTIKPASDDIVYSGNIDNWKRAGYSLMLKFALQMSKREPQLAASIINEVLASNKYIVDNSQNLGVKFGPVVNSQSPIYYYTYVSSFRDELIVSTRYVKFLQDRKDPRLDKFVTKPAGTFVTIENGFRGILPSPTTRWSRWSNLVVGENGVGPVRLITNAQRAFILAEAALTLPITLPADKTAQDFYQEGIRVSMQEAGLSSADIDAYFAANPTIVNLAGTTEQQVEQIINQKYIALTGNPLEAWNDWRRTGFPKLEQNQNAVGVNGTRPVRAQYIDQEVARNPNFSPVRQPNENVWWDVD